MRRNQNNVIVASIKLLTPPKILRGSQITTPFLFRLLERFKSFFGKVSLIWRLLLLLC